MASLTELYQYVDLDNLPFSPLTSTILQELVDAPYTSFSGSDDSSESPTTAYSNLTNASVFSPGEIFINEERNISDDRDVPVFLTNGNYPLLNSANDLSTVIPANQYDNETLQIIAQPQPSYRGRYITEVNKEKGRPNRFIRAENKDKKHPYPTIKIPPKWCDPNRYFIRVTLVTVINDTIVQHCIHPYGIITSDENVIEDPANNALYFGINQKEAVTGEKSFNLIVIKKKQDDLKGCGPMRYFDSDDTVSEHVQNLHDAKQIIATYQLRKSQLVFTVAEHWNNIHIPTPIIHTSVYSQPIVDVATDGRNSAINHANQSFTEAIKCIPRKCDWQGGEEVVIIMPYPIAHKVYTIAFDFGGGEQRSAVGITPVDRKTLLFRTPVCPIPPRHGNLKTSLVIKENNYTFHPIDFYYIAPATAPPTMNGTCARCQRSMTNGYASNKRRQIYDGDSETDGGDRLVSQMNDLSLGQENKTSRNRLSSDDKNSKVEKYLSQLRDAIAIFLRTNDPSRLFRRSRALLSDCSGDSSPLNDAIEHGHAHLALALIEQIIDMKPSHVLLEKRNENGESPLLVAARRNEWQVMKLIIEKRCDLVEVKDKDGNNLLHLLAKMDEDKGAKTIEDIFAILSNTLKVTFVEEKNKSDQTPAKVAQSHGNTLCVELLSDVTKNA